MKPCLAALLFLLTTSPLAAQSTVTAVRDLAFGVVIRNVPSTVTPSDPIKSGRYYIKHILNHQVRVAFTLPTQLPRVAGGGNLPISFSTTSAIALGTGPSSVPVTFDPNTAITFTLTTSSDFNINLGGRVAPAAAQATGAYRGTVVLTVTFF